MSNLKMKNILLLLFKLAYRFKEGFYLLYKFSVRLTELLLNIQKTNPTLFNLIRSSAGILGGLLAYKLGKFAIKIDFIRLFDIGINLLTLGYVINLSESFMRVAVFTEQLLEHVKNLDQLLHSSISELYNSLDNFYTSFKLSCNDFADYLLNKLRGVAGTSSSSSTAGSSASPLDGDLNKPLVTSRHNPSAPSNFPNSTFDATSAPQQVADGTRDGEAGDMTNTVFKIVFIVGLGLIIAGVFDLAYNGDLGDTPKG